MIKIFTLKNYVQFTSEQIILFGLLQNYNNLKIEPHNFNFKGESRYKNVIEKCKELFEYVNDITKSDLVILPYKFKGFQDQIAQQLYQDCIKYNKVLYIFFNDDYDKPILPDVNNIKIYRTSLNKSIKHSNEFALPAFSPDYFNNYMKSPNLSIGYCGHKIHGRDYYLNILLNSDLSTNFILRNGFWAPGIDKLRARKEYIENIDTNLFTFCYRGAGNFSYRFYDTMMMGRIPILIKTDSVYPFEDKYDLKSIGIVIEEKDIKDKKLDLIKIINDYYKTNKDELENIQKQNREIWEKYYCCCGFLQNVIQ